MGINLYKKAMGLKSILQSKPLKLLPDKLIYKKGDIYQMFSGKTGKKLGIMKAYLTDWPAGKSYYPEIKHNYKCLYIDGLEVFAKKQGIGKAFTDYAKKLSKNSQAEGRINILAWCLDDSKISPQIFWHKMGFTTANKSHLSEILRLEKLNDPCPQLFGNWDTYTNMYLNI